jgi:hypothetical protein
VKHSSLHTIALQSSSLRMAFIALIAAVLFCLPQPSPAAFVCYEEQYYPAVASLEQTDSGLRAILGLKFLEDGKLPTLVYRGQEGWKEGTPFPCQAGNMSCLPAEPSGKSLLPEIRLSRKDASALGLNPWVGLRLIGPEVKNGQFIWFGISLTPRDVEEEGEKRIHALGRYDTETKQTRVRQPVVLQDSYITHLLHDGKMLWLGTATDCAEGEGVPPAHGLVRYDWDKDRVETHLNTGEGPCGFVVHGLVEVKGTLWVATDLGLSRWNRKTNRWDNFLPEVNPNPIFRPTTCQALYEKLLPTLPTTINPVYGLSAHQQLIQSLKHFRPQFFNTFQEDVSGTTKGSGH